MKGPTGHGSKGTTLRHRTSRDKHSSSTLVADEVVSGDVGLSNEPEQDRAPALKQSESRKDSDDSKAGIVQPTIRASSSLTTQPGERQEVEEVMSITTFFKLLFMANLCRWAYMAYNDGVFTPDGMCAPACPGTSLGENPASLGAPWWAPGPYKDITYRIFCGWGSRPQTRIEWTGDTNELKKMVVKEVSFQGTGEIFMEREGVHGMTVWRNTLSLIDAQGKEERQQVPWGS
mmetsp:Transcript_5549/g.11557  ORF Transcript_5549/g.11557 Transcript_5549/m.11557 type:complete len:232 (-) Transcript_5549:228-923(-)